MTAIDRLMAGNQRFVDDATEHPNRQAEHREALANDQHPFAAVLSCSDSRVPTEMIFDQGFGDIFVVRTAGNVAGATEVASLAFAAEKLGIEAILVLGHEDCGAVKAAMSIVAGESEAGEYAVLSDAIAPAVLAAQEGGATGAELVADAVERNVALVTQQLPEKSAIIAGEIAARGVTVVGGVYHLKTGKVTLQP